MKPQGKHDSFDYTFLLLLTALLAVRRILLYISLFLSILPAHIRKRLESKTRKTFGFLRTSDPLGCEGRLQGREGGGGEKREANLTHRMPLFPHIFILSILSFSILTSHARKESPYTTAAWSQTRKTSESPRTSDPQGWGGRLQARGGVGTGPWAWLRSSGACRNHRLPWCRWSAASFQVPYLIRVTKIFTFYYLHIK